jgi:hypothetical protein
MVSLIRLIYFLFNGYALGLLLYMVLPFLPGEVCVQLRRLLEPAYISILRKIGASIRPVEFRGRTIDLSPFLMLGAILAIRSILVHLLTIPV